MWLLWFCGGGVVVWCDCSGDVEVVWWWGRDFYGDVEAWRGVVWRCGGDVVVIFVVSLWGLWWCGGVVIEALAYY